MSTVIERKSVVCEFKAGKTPGEFKASFSVIGNVDLDGDRIHKDAFALAEEADPNPAIVWTHMWNVPPIGETLSWSEKGDKAIANGRLFLKDHEVARQVWAGIQSEALKQYSFAFNIKEQSLTEPGDNESTPRWDGMIREIHAISRVFEWGPTLLGANPDTETMSAKSLHTLLGLGDLGIPTKGGDALDAAILLMKSGARNNADDGDRLQQIHDLSKENGATCETKDAETEDEDGTPEGKAVAALLAARPMLHLHSRSA